MRPLFHGEPRSFGAQLYKTVREYDTVAEFIKAAHELGMKLYYWDPVFDNALNLRCTPGTPDYEKYGEYPFADPNIDPKTEWEHRFAGRYPEKALAMPIGTIQVICDNLPPVTAANLALYVAAVDQPFVRYDKAFSVAVAPGSDRGGVITLSGLAIDKPCIKLVYDCASEKDLAISQFAQRVVKLTYTNGAPVDAFSTAEVTLSELSDDDIATQHRGYVGLAAGWGLVKGKYNRTVILRAGLFDRHAKGLPEHAYPANRERMVKIVSELYERYPDLDGVCFSIRSHSQPSGGGFDEVGPYLYGFSEPIVKEYQKRYGIDITTADYDVEKFLKLRGEYFTQMLREVAKVVHARNGKLEAMAPVRPQVKAYDHGSMYPLWRGMNIDNFFDIETWSREGIVDNVVMLGTGHQQNAWTPEWEAEVKYFKSKLAGTSTRLTLHYLINGSTQANVKNLLPGVLTCADLDEVEFYEEQGMFDPYLYDAFGQCVQSTPRALVK